MKKLLKRIVRLREIVGYSSMSLSIILSKNGKVEYYTTMKNKLIALKFWIEKMMSILYK